MEEAEPRGDVPGESQGFSSVPGFGNKVEQKSREQGRHPSGRAGAGRGSGLQDRGRRVVWKCV